MNRLQTPYNKRPHKIDSTSSHTITGRPALTHTAALCAKRPGFSSGNQVRSQIVTPPPRVEAGTSLETAPLPSPPPLFPFRSLPPLPPLSGFALGVGDRVPHIGSRAPHGLAEDR